MRWHRGSNDRAVRRQRYYRRYEHVRLSRRRALFAGRIRMTGYIPLFKKQLIHGFLVLVLLVSMLPLAAILSLLSPAPATQAVPVVAQTGYRWFDNQDATIPTFAVGWGTPGDDIARDAATDADGNIYVAGYVASRYGQASNSMDQSLVKYNSSGIEQWSVMWGGAGTDYGYAVELDSSGNIYLAGYTDSTGLTSGGYDQTLVKFNSSGVEQWSKTWGGASYNDYARGMTLDSAGNIYVVGSAGSAANGFEQSLVKYNTSGVEQWSKTWGGTGSERALGVKLDSSNNIYVIGETASTDRSAGLLDQTLVKYNSTGIEQWSKTWGGTGNDTAWDLVIDSSTNIYVVGSTASTTFSAGLTDQTLIKYNSLGVEQWTKTWGGTADDTAFGVDLDSSGNIYVGGYTESSGLTTGLEDQTLIKYNTSGVEQWTKTWGSSDNDEDVIAVKVDSSDNIIAVGYTMSADLTAGGQDQTLLKFDSNGTIADCTTYCFDRTTTEVNRTTAEVNRTVAETNVTTAEVNRSVTEENTYLMTTRVHCGPVAGFESLWSTGGYAATGLAVDAQENSYVTGYDGNDQVLIKYNSLGVEQWSKRWGGAATDIPYGVALDSSGNIFVIGTSNSSGYSGDTGFGNQTLVKYNSSGVEQWSKDWGGTGADVPYGIAIDSSGNIFVAGTSKSSGYSSETTNGDQTLVKYNSSGVVQWSKSWGGTGLDVAYGLALDSSGNIFVAGTSKSSGYSSETTNGDQTLVKYNSSGVVQWSKSWGGTGLDVATGLALDNLNNIYVAGTSTSPGLVDDTTYGDQTLVKYNSSGVEQWSKSRGVAFGEDYSDSIVVSPGGDIYVGGHLTTAGPTLVKYDANGELQWDKRWGNIVSVFADYRRNNVVIGASGNVYMAATIDNFSDSPSSTFTISLVKTLPGATDISGSIKSDNYTVVDRTTTEVDRAVAEVDRTTTEVDRAVAETDIPSSQYFQNEVIAESTIDVGAPLNGVARNTATLAPSAGGAFRLRVAVNVHASSTTLPAGETYKLQYAQRSGTCDTTFSGETYADVTTGTPIAYYDNPIGYDGQTVALNPNDPYFMGIATNTAQTYQELNNATTINPTTPGNSALFDFALSADSAPMNTAYCLRVVTSGGSALTTMTVPEIITPPLDFSQSSHRWFDNDLAALASQNTAAEMPRRDAPVRLRILLDPVKAAPISSADIKLQYAPRVGTCDVGFSGESYVDVTTSTPIAYYDNPLYGDGSTITSSGSDPTDGNTIVYQAFEEAAPFTNPNVMTATGQSGLWDISLTVDAEAPGGAYCFRVVQQATGAVLSAYDYVPELLVPPAMSQVMRHGKFFSETPTGTDDSRQPFYW